MHQFYSHGRFTRQVTFIDLNLQGHKFISYLINNYSDFEGRANVMLVGNDDFFYSNAFFVLTVDWKALI